MTTIIRATVPASQFALADTFEAVPTAEFEIVRLVADRMNRFIPLLWATADDPGDFESLPAAVADDGSTNAVEVIDQFDHECLLKMGWQVNTRVIFSVLMEPEAAILDSCGKDGMWHFCILFLEHDAVSTMYETCKEYDIDVSLRQVTPLEDSFWQGRYGLTKNQYETIVGAYQEGYYRVPRNTSLEGLSSNFDVSHQAISERLRRGHEKLIANAMNREATADSQAHWSSGST